VQFIDLKHQQTLLRKQIVDNILAVLDHGHYIMGPEISRFEKQLADFVGVKNAVACASGTDALLMALMACNVGPGDAVFTTPFTFIATAEVIQLLGATPVFVDVDPETFNINPDNLLKAYDALIAQDASTHPLPLGFESIRPKAIVTVDLFGLPADYAAINTLAQRKGLWVIEDGAQSFGAQYKGKRACSLAAIGCTSFFPAKPLGGYGDGGMCFTDDEKFNESLCSIRIHGRGVDKYDNIRIGINGRLDTIQAAVLLAKFTIFQKEIVLRQQVANTYNTLISEKTDFIAPKIPDDSTSIWAQYSVLAADEAHRSRTLRTLKEAGIPANIYYPKPLHLQTAFKNLSYRQGDFPISEDISMRIFSLPMHPYMETEDQEKIVEVLSRLEA
jgi:UDP-2-acetamido-2-deoxy-ribo-hexuluronate aminotransferase